MCAFFDDLHSFAHYKYTPECVIRIGMIIVYLFIFIHSILFWKCVRKRCFSTWTFSINSFFSYEFIYFLYFLLLLLLWCSCVMLVCAGCKYLQLPRTGQDLAAHLPGIV